MSKEIQFPRNIDNLLASADQCGLMVIAGWSMLISKASAIEYVKNYNTSPNEGFFKHEGKVILSHGAGKLTLSEQEASAVVELIKATYASSF